MDKMNPKDFAFDEDNVIFSTNNTVWTKETPIYVFMDGDNEESDLERMLPKVNELAQWIEDSKPFFVNRLIEDGYLKSISEELEKEGTAPLTEKSLSDLIYLEHVAIYFRDGEGFDFDDFAANEDEPVVSICIMNDTIYEVVYTIYHDKTIHCEGCR